MDCKNLNYENFIVNIEINMKNYPLQFLFFIYI
jgi:hypothetical protein